MELNPIQFSDLRTHLAEYLDQCSQKGRRFSIRRHSKDEAVLVSGAEWREITETLAVLDDPALLAQLVHSLRDVERGRVREAGEVFDDLLNDAGA